MLREALRLKRNFAQKALAPSEPFYAFLFEQIAGIALARRMPEGGKIRDGVVTFAAFTCQQLGAAKNRIEENQRVRESDATADPSEIAYSW
jgi:hypothetical protein